MQEPTGRPPPPDSRATGLSPVERTALATARQRAIEHERPDRLFEDPLARALVLAATGEGITPGTPPAPLDDYFAVRTSYFDRALLAANRRGCSQIVLLGAGLDTRAHRLAWLPATRLFEVDLAPLQAFKRAVLDQAGAVPTCELVTVGADLAGDWIGALRASGLDRRPTAWLAEGLLFYLRPDTVDALVGVVSEQSPAGSELAVEQVNPVISAMLEPVLAREEPGAPWWSTTDDPARLYLDHGWRAEVTDCVRAGVEVGRPVRLPPAPGAEPPMTWFAVGRRHRPG